MSFNWKYLTIQITIGLLLTGVLLGAYFLGKAEQNKILCKDIRVTVKDARQTRFVTEQAVKEYLTTEYEGIIGKPIGQIDLLKVEKILSDKIAISACNAYLGNDGYLNVSIEQRKPVVRFQAPGYGFYCDNEGHLIPTQATFTADVPVIDGYIPIDTTDCNAGHPIELEKAEWLANIVSMSKTIDASPIWRESISQIHCNEEGDLIIVTKLGKEKFLFGHPSDVRAKLEKMKIYYEMIAAQEDKNYNLVDLRFDKQIICKNNK
jgi:hypothetical protein